MLSRFRTLLQTASMCRAAGDSAKAKSYLPHNKQYLLTRNGV